MPSVCCARTRRSASSRSSCSEVGLASASSRSPSFIRQCCAPSRSAGAIAIVRVSQTSGTAAVGIDAADLAQIRGSITTLSDVGAFTSRDLVAGDAGTHVPARGRDRVLEVLPDRDEPVGDRRRARRGVDRRRGAGRNLPADAARVEGDAAGSTLDRVMDGRDQGDRARTGTPSATRSEGNRITVSPSFNPPATSAASAFRWPSWMVRRAARPSFTTNTCHAPSC